MQEPAAARALQNFELSVGRCVSRSLLTPAVQACRRPLSLAELGWEDCPLSIAHVSTASYMVPHVRHTPDKAGHARCLAGGFEVVTLPVTEPKLKRSVLRRFPIFGGACLRTAPMHSKMQQNLASRSKSKLLQGDLGSEKTACTEDQNCKSPAPYAASEVLFFYGGIAHRTVPPKRRR